jgi:hypothetical protein
MTLDEFLSHFQNVRRAGNGYSARCSGHDDRKNSLSIGERDGKILVKCHAGCETESVLDAVGLKLSDLFSENGSQKPHDPVIARYIYTDENRKPLYRVCRTASKNFFQERFAGDTFIPGLNGTRRVLYNLPELIKAKTVFSVEGEKDCETLQVHGLVGTTNAGGADAWNDADALFFKGKWVVIIPDNDEPGRRHAWKVAISVLRVAREVRLVELPDVPEKGDVSDFLKDHTKDDLLKIIRDAKPLAVEDIESHKFSREEEKSKSDPPGNVWSRAKDAPTFLAETDTEISGLAKDLIIPGAIALVASPRGLGKSMVAQCIAVSIAVGGEFRGEKVTALRVLLVDRDNPKKTVKDRLRGFGAEHAPNLKVLTREDAPDLHDKKSWESFPVSDYDVIVIDSLGSFTEGVTEREGKETTLILATVLDLIHRGPAVLLLANCTKDALSVKGRGEWMDRVDIIYEVRDATAFTPSGKKDWWLELPAAGEAAWGERAARRKNRTDYRLAFVPSKFRLGAQPDPFCLELRLPENEPWTLEDVTADLIQAGENVIKESLAKKEQKEKASVEALSEVVVARHAKGTPILKTEALDFLHEMEITRDRARELIKANIGVLWNLEHRTGKGNPQALIPVLATKGRENGAYEGKSAADRAQSGPQKCDPCNSVTDKNFSDTRFSRRTGVSTPEAIPPKDPWDTDDND